MKRIITLIGLCFSGSVQVSTDKLPISWGSQIKQLNYI